MRIWREELLDEPEPEPAVLGAVGVRRLADRAWLIRPLSGESQRVLRGYRKPGWVAATWRSSLTEPVLEGLAALRHANVAQIFDLGLTHHPFSVHEYVSGVSTETLAGDRAIPLDLAVYIAIETASGLHHLHENYGPHGAISPHNIYVSDDGDVKLLGYEKRYVEYTTADDISFIPAHRPLAYISPERLMGGREEEDQRGDQFCLAECLCTWIAGRNPFSSTPFENDFQRLYHRRAVFENEHTLPPLSAGSAAVIRLIERAMRVDPAQRLASLRCFRDQLSAAHALESSKVKEQLGRFVRAQMPRILSQPVPTWAAHSCW